jgi:hypothetical protein
MMRTVEVDRVFEVVEWTGAVASDSTVKLAAMKMWRMRTRYAERSLWLGKQVVNRHRDSELLK